MLNVYIYIGKMSFLFVFVFVFTFFLNKVLKCNLIIFEHSHCTKVEQYYVTLYNEFLFYLRIFLFTICHKIKI